MTEYSNDSYINKGVYGLNMSVIFTATESGNVSHISVSKKKSIWNELPGDTAKSSALFIQKDGIILYLSVTNENATAAMPTEHGEGLVA